MRNRQTQARRLTQDRAHRTSRQKATSTAVATANSVSPRQTEAVSSPGGFLAAKKSSRTEYAVEGIISFAESNAA
jgi:hypothetical protein